MNNFFSETLPLFGFGILGILIMALVKMNDINKRNESYTFWLVVRKFSQREWPSYSLSLVIIFTAALTHEEWIPLLVSKKIPDTEVFNEIGGLLKLSMVAVGCVGQYFIYKRLGKLTKEQVNNSDSVSKDQ